MRQMPLSRYALLSARLSGIVLIACLLPAFASPVAGLTVTVDPVAVTIPAGSVVQITATVTGTKSSKNLAVVWSVNGVAGGNSVVGTVTGTGLYTAPAVPPNGWTVSVKATSVAAFGVSYLRGHRSKSGPLPDRRRSNPLPPGRSP